MSFLSAKKLNFCFLPQPGILHCGSGFRGGSGGSLEPPSGTKLFQLHGEIYEKSGKILKTNPLLMDLNPLQEILDPLDCLTNVAVGCFLGY